MALHWIGDHPKGYEQRIHQKQSADKQDQLDVLQHLVLENAAGTREYPVHSVGLGKHRSKGQRESGGEQIDAGLVSMISG